jgi:ABC-2 type transport system ATP-binding protein
MTTTTVTIPEATGREPAIVTRGLTKHYGEVEALVDLDLEVQRGEVFGFLGPNGAGKSTTIRVLLDLLRPTRGTATVLGHDSHADGLEVRRRTGYVPGDLALYPKLTGRQVLAYLGSLRGGVDWAHVEELAERLQSDLDRRVGDLSTGNRQKVGLIQAFMHRPDLLVLDEPNAGLDPLVQQELIALMREARDEGRTVFLSSHTLSEVERVADRVGIIREGRLVVVERVDALKSRAVRRLELHFAAPVPTDLFAGVPGVQEAVVEGSLARLRFEGSVNQVLHAALAHEVVELHTREADLEEIFLAFYRGDRTEPRAGVVL